MLVKAKSLQIIFRIEKSKEKKAPIISQANNGVQSLCDRESKNLFLLVNNGDFIDSPIVKFSKSTREDLIISILERY